MRRAYDELIFATFLAPNIQPVYEAVARTVGAELGRPTRLVLGQSWDQVRAGDVDFAFMCGLPYVRLAAESPALVVPVAAPVLEGERYEGRPIYFSDVIVRAGDPAAAFNQLGGRAWAYNDPDSHSGYLATLRRLMELDLSSAFFGRTVMTGFHQVSIRAVVSGEVDASAIDSQVLAVELRRHPELEAALKIIDTFGPSPIQPLVAARHVPDDLREHVADVVTAMQGDELKEGLVQRFVTVGDAQYDDIRMALVAVEARGLSL